MCYLLALASGHVQSHLRWGFGGGFAAPEDIFIVFWRLRRQKTIKSGAWGAAPRVWHMPSRWLRQAQPAWVCGIGEPLAVAEPAEAELVEANDGLLLDTEQTFFYTRKTLYEQKRRSMSTPFLMWYDDNPKLSVARKIEDAIGAYRHRFPQTTPTLVLVNEAEVTEVVGVEVRGMATVHRNTVWVGLEREEIPTPMSSPSPQVVQPRQRKVRR